MIPAAPPARGSQWRLIATCVAIAGLSTWLRLALPILGVGNGEFDDMLFVRLAAHMAAGEWLGPYGNLTLAKGAAFPAFIAATHVLGIPLKLAEHAVYLGASWMFARSIAGVIGSRRSFPILFAILALNPAVWAAEAGGRIVRENLYVSLTLLLLALAIRLYSTPRDLRREWPALLAFGLVGGLFWITREEGAWIVPALIVIADAWLARARRANDLPAVAIAFALAAPAAAFAAVVLAVNALNHHYYGVFRNNDFRSSDFQSGYGALARIGQDEMRRFVVFPKDARLRAYAASANARQLQPYLDGELGRSWARVGCEQTAIRPCDEILSGWFMWALRDAVAQAGHYRSAREAEGFYKALAAEIDEACAAKRIPCGPPRRTLVPAWRPEFAAWTAESGVKVARTLLTLGDMQVRTLASVGDAAQLGLMRRMTRAKLASTTDLHPIGLAYDTARAITAAQRMLHMVSLLLGIAALAFAFRRSGATVPAVALAAVLAAIATRIALLAFLDATSIPSNNLLYLSPSLPLSLALGPAAMMLAWQAARAPRRFGRSTPERAAVS